MALSGIQIFKMTPKKNCKECGCPTCMAFSMKVAQGAMDISACPYMSDDAMAQLSEGTAPPMKTIKVGTGDSEYTLGGETVLYRLSAAACLTKRSMQNWKKTKKLITTVSVSVCAQRCCM